MMVERLALTEMIESFMEICAHSVLYYREIYPRVLFEQRQLGKPFTECKSIYFTLRIRGILSTILVVRNQSWMCSILVWQCRHPEVNEYLKRVLSNAQSLLRAVCLSIRYQG